jgi:two-component SAPR family response regulator
MAKSGPIIIVDDDAEDYEFINMVFAELKIRNKIIYFEDTEKAFKFLKETQENPFLIFCDINLPRQNGLEFKRNIDNDTQLRRKSIPFVFFSTAIDKKAVDMAYEEMTVQGFFQKPNSFDELKGVIKVIMDYWRLSKEPNG